MFGRLPFGSNPFADTGAAQSLSAPEVNAPVATGSIGGMFGTGTFGALPFSNVMMAAAPVQSSASGGGGGGSPRAVRAYASLFDPKPAKQAAKAAKKSIKRAMATEALEILPDAALAVAPLFASLAYLQSAPRAPQWTPSSVQPVVARQQQNDYQKNIDDEHEIELLLLG